MATGDIYNMSKDFYVKSNGYEPKTWFSQKTVTRMLDAHNFSKRTENCIAFKRSEAHRADIILNYDSLTRATLIKNKCAEYIDGKFTITQPQCVWNADETALRGKRTKKRKVWVLRGQKEVYTTDTATDSKEMITGLFFINLAGECTAPFVLFDTKHVNSNHCIPNCDIVVASNGSGWMTQPILLEFFKTKMLAELKKRAPEGVTPTLLWDSHSSHLGYDLLKLCADNGVCCQAIPPNGSILYQPLDNKFNNNFQNRIADIKAPSHYTFKQSILYKVQTVLGFKEEMKTLVLGSWAACGFVQIPNSPHFTFDKEILMNRLGRNISQAPICKRLTDIKTREIATTCMDNVFKDNEHKRKRDAEPDVENKRKKVAEFGEVSTSGEFLERLRISEEEKAAKKSELEARKAARVAKRAENESASTAVVETVKNKPKKQPSIANFFAKKQ